MKIAQDALLDDLVARTQEILEQAKFLQSLPEDVLMAKPDAETWSVLECLEHLNRYGRFYLPEIKQRIQGGKPVQPAFRSSWLGEYFAKSMLPKEKLNRMQTFTNMNPVGSSLDLSVLDEFVEQQHTMLRLLEAARQVSLKRTKTAISISKRIRLRLGDTFRVVVYHNQRHLVQAQGMADLFSS
ncbi:MAG TPA: hypothetical protein DCE41_25575 [Cytophagales bacterium]|nr:hypothetical protein [Cytophagales bacterium]HAA19910.1 hypothetical protein [Cytophagales bacterium]HAP62663.1 hypothetical protein [Cytophagales bacterium]